MKVFFEAVVALCPDSLFDVFLVLLVLGGVFASLLFAVWLQGDSLREKPLPSEDESLKKAYKPRNHRRSRQ